MADGNSSKRAQGASEYLLILGVALLVGIGAITLMGGYFGTSDEKRLAENRIYWQSQTVAIVDGVASDVDRVHSILGYRESDDISVVLLTLQNNGRYPVELIALKSNYLQNVSGTEYGVYFPSTIGYQFTSPDVLNASYTIYKAPPKGSNISSSYSEETVLQPGEKITIGYGVASSLSAAYGGPDPVRICVEGSGSIRRNYLEYGNFSIYYATRIGNERVMKVESGMLLLRCVNSITS